VIGEGGEEVAEDEEHRHAQHGAVEGGEAPADQAHQHHVARLLQAHGLGEGAEARQRVEPPRQSGEGGRQREHRPLVARRVVAERPGARLALLDRADHLAEGRVDDPPEDDRRQHEEDVDEVVEGKIVPQGERAPDREDHRSPLDAGEAIFAAGPGVEEEHHEPEHDPEGDGEQREVDAALARHEERDHPAAHHRACHADEQRQPEAARPRLLAHPEQVAADTEEGAVPEGGQARVAEEQVVTEGEDRPDHHLRAQVRVADIGKDGGEDGEHAEHREHGRRREGAHGPATAPASTSDRRGRAAGRGGRSSSAGT